MNPISADAAGPALTLAPDSGPPPAFDGERAMQYVKDIVKFGPRPVGSANHKKVEEYIASHLKGDQVEDDNFTADTPEGKFPVHNIIAKYPGTKDGIIVIASHYDTNYPLRNTSYVGANDGGSSSALLLELANQLRGKPRDGYSVWLVWDDAEEAMKPDGSGGLPKEMPFDEDSLYGITHLAEKWQSDGTLKKIKAFLLADMIGDADLNIDRDLNSTPWLENVVGEAAKRLGYQSHFFERTNEVGDDHIPFMKRGVPSADLIDFSYGYNNVFWHTHAGHRRQAQPQEPANRRQRDPRNRAHPRQDGPSPAKVTAALQKPLTAEFAERWQRTQRKSKSKGNVGFSSRSLRNLSGLCG